MIVKRRNLEILALLVLLLVVFASSAFGQDTLQAPKGLKIVDTPYDNGTGVCLIWEVSPSDAKGVNYLIYSSSSENGPFEQIKLVASTAKYLSDFRQYFGFDPDNRNYHCIDLVYPTDDNGNLHQTYYRISIDNGETEEFAPQTVTTMPVEQWIAWNKTNNFILLLTMFLGIGYFINRAKHDPNLFIRRIPGLEAVDEAVGRATEMGRPLLYLTGTYEINQLSTIASVNILRRVAETVARYDSRLIVPHRRPITMTVCQEVVHEAYVKAGRADAYREDDIYFVTEDAFGFVAAADGIMVREKPAANFFLGTFAAESLLLAETGANTGAIQIAGTDSTYQIPFFIVACDYTLIGEELYAASAYLSREPKLLGSLRGQDFGKAILLGALTFSTLGACLYSFFPGHQWLLWLQHFFTKL